MKFKIWYAQKVALKPAKTIIRMTRVVVLLQLLIVIGLWVAGLYAVFKDHIFIALLLFALEIYFAFYFRKFALDPYAEIINNILLEKIDLERFLAFVRTLSQQAITSKQRTRAKEALLQQEAQVDYLMGNFDSCLEKLERFQPELIPSRFRASYRNGTTQLRLMCLLQHKQWEEAEALLEKLEINKEQAEAVITISKGGVTTYFDTWEPKWRLEKISNTYNQGRNLLNQGKTEQAKECFASIINENPQLFIVRRAKQYVEELS